MRRGRGGAVENAGGDWALERSAPGIASAEKSGWAAMGGSGEAKGTGAGTETLASRRRDWETPEGQALQQSSERSGSGHLPAPAHLRAWALTRDAPLQPRAFMERARAAAAMTRERRGILLGSVTGRAGRCQGRGAWRGGFRMLCKGRRETTSQLHPVLR